MHGCHWREFLGRWPSRSPGTWRLLLLLPRQTGGSRRGIHDTLKPKDLMNSTLDKKIQSKDVLLFRYEDPGRVFRRSAMAFGTFPVWTYLSYFSYNLKSELDGIREGFESSQAYRSRGWVLDNVQKASGSVAVAFFMFGETILKGPKNDRLFRKGFFFLRMRPVIVLGVEVLQHGPASGPAEGWQARDRGDLRLFALDLEANHDTCISCECTTVKIPSIPMVWTIGLGPKHLYLTEEPFTTISVQWDQAAAEGGPAVFPGRQGPVVQVPVQPRRRHLQQQALVRPHRGHQPETVRRLWQPCGLCCWSGRGQFSGARTSWTGSYRGGHGCPSSTIHTDVHLSSCECSEVSPEPV